MSNPSPANTDALYEERDWLLDTLSSIGDAVITTDSHDRLAFLNPVAETLTGWPMQEAVGRAVDDVFRIIDENTRRPVNSITARAFRERRIIKLESPCLLVARNGKEIPFDDSAAPIRNDQREVTGVVLIFRDITQRRETERALAKSLGYADDIISTLRGPFLVLDASLRVRTANRAFYDAFRVSKEETENSLVYDLGNGQWDIPGLRKLLDEVLTRNQSVHDFEVEHAFPVLGRKFMLLNARPFPPDSDHPELILLAVEDVSAIRARADELAEAERHKDEFLATLAHELRNPLAPIRNAVQFLGAEGASEPGAKTAREMIARQVAVMVRLIDELLDVSRISRNKMDVQKQRIELSTVIKTAEESGRPLIEECGHELTVRLPPEPLYLNADPVRLAQAFINLLNNAAKYTNRGGHILIEVVREGSDAVVRVRDDGVGIPADMLVRIFDMFTQVDRSLEQSRGGLGIGLTLVRRLVELHDGTIEARSPGPGRGSEFIVRLPLILASEEQPPKSDGPPSPSLSGLRILVVDDNRDSAESLGMLLGIKGNDIRTTYDGREAMKAAESFRPELILLDIGLPKLNGYDIARRIREQAWGRAMTIIALTGWGREGDRAQSKAAGCDGHLVKPVDLSDLEQALEELAGAGK